MALGQREVREGLRRGSPLWTLSSFFALPATVWGRPELRPGSAEFEREVFARYGLFSADTPNDGLPLGLLRTERTLRGEPGIALSCEACHSSSLFGKLVVGQPNPFVNVEQLWDDLNQSSVALGQTNPFVRVDQLISALTGAHGSRDEHRLYWKTPAGISVVNGADHLGYLGVSLRNPDLSLSLAKAARLLGDGAAGMKKEFDALAYVKTPPWYSFATKAQGSCGYYADGGQPKTGNFAAFTYLMSFRDLNGKDVAGALLAWQRSGPAFLSSLTPPRYPFAVRAALLPAGRRLYDAHCARCHGRYAPGDVSPQGLSYPGLIVAAPEVGTDPKRAYMPAPFVARTRTILKEEYTITGGYAEPPLTAIWARAPYLHNGSVPTLAELLDPPNRRAKYVLLANPDSRADFDQARVGWQVAAPPPAGTSAVRRLYDPSLVAGLANAGHLYGAELDAGEREALIEFLKTL